MMGLAGELSRAVPVGELVVLAQARWPEPADEQLPQVAGFVLSSFNPLIAAAADRCLRRYHGEPPARRGERTAVVVVSASGDLASAEHVAHTVDAGQRLGPLFFFQSVPNSVAGHVAARWELGGPVVCLCPTGDPMADGLAEAALLMADGDADEALVVHVEQGRGDGEQDRAVAVLARPAHCGGAAELALRRRALKDKSEGVEH